MRRRPVTTSIGSWPGVSIDRALDWAFELELPALPELQELGPEHDMIGVLLSGAASSRPAFLERVDRRRPGAAKMQTVGPGTLLELKRRREPRVQRLSDSELLERVRTRALGDAEALLRRGTTPVIYLDEPLLFASEPSGRWLPPLLQELRSVGARVGLHTCGPVPWCEALELPLDYLAFDATRPDWPRPSPEALHRFRARGGRLVLGVVSALETASLPTLQRDYGLDVDLSFSCGLAGVPVEEVPGRIRRLQLFRQGWVQPPMF